MSDELVGQQAAVVHRRIDSPVAAVWSVLADGWMYATWVVGTSRVRDVDAHWPALGAKIHHSFGLWPVVINDTSEVLSCEPERELTLKARGWPVGEAHVTITVESTGTGETSVSIREDVVAGPALVVPRPLRQFAIAARNTEALRRLGYLAVGRAHDAMPGGPQRVAVPPVD